ncbi:hypothetical protein PM10SUCC1_16770 [Propionigenium maris DSM 9537]|uniref:ABC transmembrane type-1 domain-containing protein n=1 Tax=Propionigenium maris DSM 9537 TaxID=1123000 RepID=A0A9W6LN31_9FUSO|nr:ABC transporter permease subunit [Propionigenium maris]GLI56163.1 hypothetical protein PM10SUCC1_16770 [Propionigenium maris DSM 9537]
MKKNFILNTLYLLLWLLPIGFFARDFFNPEDLLEVLSADTLKIVVFTTKQALISALFSFIVAIVPAYYITYNKNKMARFIEGLIFIPFFFPVISTIVSFSIIFNLEFLRNFQVLYTLKAIIIANTFYNSPIFLKYIAEGMRAIPGEILEAARVDGAGERKIFLSVKLPLIMPQLFRGFFLVFVYCFTSFAIILSLGGINFSTLEVVIATTLMGSFDFSRAFALGITQFILLTLLNSAGQRIEAYELHGKQSIRKTSFLVGIISLIYMAVQYLIVGTGLIFAFFDFYRGRFSLTSFIGLFSRDLNASYPVIKGLINSLAISGCVSVLTLIFTYLILRNYTKITNYIIFSTFGMSSAFLAITLIYMNILWYIPLGVLLIAGYFLTSVPIAYSFLFQYVTKFPEDIREAARVDGASSLKIFTHIELPILKNILISVFLQIFAIIFGEFTITYTMQTGSVLPLASLTNYSLASNKMFLESAAMSSLNLIIIIGLFVGGQYLKEREVY